MMDSNDMLLDGDFNACNYIYYVIYLLLSFFRNIINVLISPLFSHTILDSPITI